MRKRVKVALIIILIVIFLILIPKPYSYQEGSQCGVWDWQKESGWCIGIIYYITHESPIECAPQSWASETGISNPIEFKHGWVCVGAEIFKSGVGTS